MAKSNKKQKQKLEIVRPGAKAPNWNIFFRDQRCPFIRSQLITAMLAGQALEVDRIPTISLLDVLLLASTGRNYFEAEIIDDFDALKKRVDEAWSQPNWTCRIFDQYHRNAASFILSAGTTHFACHEDAYIPDLMEWMLQNEPPQYFVEEFEVKKKVKKLEQKIQRLKQPTEVQRVIVVKDDGNAGDNYDLPRRFSW